MAKYKQLVDKFIQDIEAGKLVAEQRILSLRQFAKQHNISLSTAVNCYAELESLGRIISRPQAGFFIAPTQQKTLTPEWQPFTSHVVDIRKQHLPKTIKNGPLGTSRLLLDDKAKLALERSFRRASKQMPTRLSNYPDLQGESTFRNALSSHFSHMGFSFSADELIITHGCMDAVKTALLVCTQAGDTVAVSSPCYNGLLELLSQLHLKVIEIPSIKTGIDLDQLELHLQAKTIKAGLFCTTHMNPQGITMSVAQKKRLAQLANFYCVPMIEDDVYLELPHHNAFPLPATYYDENGYMVWCGSLSKTLSPSYRIGWCKPNRYFKAYLKRSLGVPTVIQLAMADFLTSNAYQQHLKRARYQLLHNKQHYLSYLNQHLPPGYRITQPDGGLVLWIQIPNLDNHSFALQAEEANLDIRIGSVFTESNRYQDCLRINIGFPLNDDIKKEIDLMLLLISLN
ncbi:PLP-dependent aminotransferase family protein [Vibrio rumoiensis]|uniref:Transcriptional regulator n=1 Tax=Vibrio rumoiensis 1S-45 TaxID=1188252 RepID=A0A1E5E2M4_9VIBR|nr:PLP-dependent aminotransferase family protein [Vibrio rumoiensis]OEF25780.1 transcriptional regulator [Vibrio rumoiensis 1S-45]